MKQTMLFAAGGLLLGGIIHIAVVMMVPLFAGHNAWAEMARFGSGRQFHVLPLSTAAAEPLPMLDPKMMHAICRFSLAGGPVRMTAAMPDDFWSVGVFDRQSRSLYSMNDRSSAGPQLDLVVGTPAEMAELRQNPPDWLEDAILVETTDPDGFAVLRVFVADDSLTETAAAALKTADCAAPF